MARRQRKEYPGAIYHVFDRGVEKRNIFLDNHDFIYFQYLCNELSTSHQMILHSYCLMNNHYHLLIETPLGNLSSIMKKLNENYSMRFNNKYDRVGGLYQGRFQDREVLNNDYFLQVSRYIHLNPVEAELVSDPADWEWSSFRAFVNKSAPLSCLKKQKVLECLPKDQSLEGFWNYTKEGLKNRTLLQKGFLGCESIEEQVKNQINLKQEYKSLKNSLEKYGVDEKIKDRMLNYCFREKFKLDYKAIAANFADIKYEALKKSSYRLKKELCRNQELASIVELLIKAQ